MPTETTEHQLPNLLPNGYMPTADSLIPNGPVRSARGSWFNAAALVIPVLFASVLTSGVTYNQPSQQARYASCSLFSPFRRRKGRRVSLQEARMVALRVYAEAEQQLRSEQTEEAQFILRVWDDAE